MSNEDIYQIIKIKLNIQKMKITKMTYGKDTFRKQLRLGALLLVLTAGFCMFLSLNSNSVEARCPTRPQDCNPAGPQGPVGGDGAPGIKRCEGDDIDNTKDCKKDYRACNKGDKTRAEKIQCKKQVIQDHKKPSNPGGDRPGGDGEGPPAIGEAGDYICGTYDDESKNVHTKFDFGCIGTDFAQSGQGQKNISPILDLAYAVVRFLSIGVGIVIAISIIMSGIQYSMSEGNAEVTQKAKSRIRSAILGLAIYIFVFSIVQFLVPGGVFRPGMWVDESVLQLITRLNIWIF